MKNKTIWVINQYASTPETGIGGRHFYLSKELVKQGYKVVLIGASYSHILHKPKAVNSPYTFYNYDGVDIVTIRVPRYKNSLSIKRVINWFLFAFRLRRINVEAVSKPDIIIYSSAPLIGYLGAKYLSTKLAVPLVFEVRDIWPLSLCEIGGYSKKNLFIQFLQWIEDKAYKDSDIVISNLKNSYKHMAQRGLLVNKFHWLPNGFLLEEVLNKEPLDENVLLNIPDNKFIVGYTGTFGLANTLDTFLDAAEYLKSNENIAFVLVGGGKNEESLKKIRQEKKLSNVYFIKQIPKVQIQSMLSLFDVCYIGLTKDPLFRFGVSPNKLFDYFYSAKPIIYGIDSGDYNPVSSVNSGIEITPENVSALVDAIIELYELPVNQRYEMGQRGRKLALAKYEYSVLAKKLSNLLFPCK